MLGTIGNLTVYVSFVALLVSTVMFFMNARGKRTTLRSARISFNVAATALIVGCLTLLVGILTHDFSLEYVAQYSSRDLPLLYLISTFWAGQMGTFLLWAGMLAVCGLIVMRRKDKLESGAMTILSLVTLAMVVIFLKKSPFATLEIAPTDGQGLNPLLQDFWMAIHPPIMFIGFATAAVPFAFAIAALYQNKRDKWEARARTWTLVSWLTIGLSLMMGGYWAYKVLGWGGYWAWDPVENSSLIPWLFLTAQLHVLVIRRRRSGLSKFSPLLVSLTFISVLYGTFLTRSGVLQDFSVHSFVDLGLNAFLIAALVFFIAITAIAFQLRWSDLKSESSFTSVNSMAYMLTVGVIILFLGAFLTIGGTSAPLLTALTENPSAVEMSFYTVTMTPIALLTLLTLALFPFFKWQKGTSDAPILASGAVIFVGVTLITKLMFAVDSWWWSIMIGAGAWALFSNLYQLRKVISFGFFPSAPIIHIGLALLLIGATSSSGLESKDTVTLVEGETVTAMGHELVYTGYTPFGSDTSFNVSVKRVGSNEPSFDAKMYHINKNPEMGVVKTPHIQKGLLVDLYFSPLGSETAGSGGGPLVAEMKPGQSVKIGGYLATFLGTEAVREAPDKPARKLKYVVDITRDGYSPERLTPSFEMEGTGFNSTPDTLSDGLGVVALDINNMGASGGMNFIFSGSFSEGPAAQANVLAVEFSQKPLISLVWIGTILLFLGGGFAIRGAIKNPCGGARIRAEERAENRSKTRESDAGQVEATSTSAR